MVQGAWDGKEDRALNQVLQETKPQTQQDIMFGWGGPQLVPLWSGEQMHREVWGPAKALE